MELFNIIFDLGGVLSLITTVVITLIVVLKFKVHEYLIERLKMLQKTDPLRIMIIFILLLVGLISIWLTVRAIALYTIKRYILTVNYIYTLRDIFEMVAFILTANLCFTLLKALTLKGENKDEYVAIKGFIDVAIQAVIIGFITFLPRVGGQFLSEIGGSIGYALIVVSMMVSILVLVFARQRLSS